MTGFVGQIRNFVIQMVGNTTRTVKLIEAARKKSLKPPTHCKSGKS